MRIRPFRLFVRLLIRATTVVPTNSSARYRDTIARVTSHWDVSELLQARRRLPRIMYAHLISPMPMLR